jgi:antirestriction protein ArdC
MNTRRNTTRRSDQPARDHYAEVTDQIIAALEAGTPPWRRPWDVDKAVGPTMPCNATTGMRYRGINTLVLGMSPFAFASGDPRWATYKQANDRGWQVRKGSRGTTAYFFKRIEVRDTSAAPDNEGGVKRIPLLRAFTLFHASQIEGMPDFVPPTIAEAPWRAPEATETIVANSKAVVRVGGDRAFYSPMTDHIQMPPREAFHSASGWSSTIIHELAHWSGSGTRLNRDLRNSFGSHDYAREELRAELSMCLVAAELNLEDCDFTNSASYLASWLEKLRSDRKEIFRAAADAQRIADYLLAFHPDWVARDARSASEDADTEQDSTMSGTPSTGLAEAA